MNAKLCSQCEKIIQMPASISRVKEDDFCDDCYRFKLKIESIIKENRELIEDLKREW
jgi:hypothetical protein